MNAHVLIIECLMIAVLFTLMVIVMANKAETMVADYPPEIQDAYYKSQGKIKEKEKLTAKNYVAKGVFCVVALILAVWLSSLAGAVTFAQGFEAAVIYILAIFAVDTFVIDWIIFPRVKKWRLPGTENMDKEYSQKWFHVKACFPAIPFALLFAVLCGCIVMWMH